MKTSELQGALLDYHTARAEGVPADQLEIRPVQRPDPRTPDTICVRRIGDEWLGAMLERIDYSTNWALSGPLLEKHGIAPVPFTHNKAVDTPDGDMQFPEVKEWGAFICGEGGHYIDTYPEEAGGSGDTPLIAICRAVVRAAFGDEVEDLSCA